MACVCGCGPRIFPGDARHGYGPSSGPWASWAPVSPKRQKRNAGIRPRPKPRRVHGEDVPRPYRDRVSCLSSVPCPPTLIAARAPASALDGPLPRCGFENSPAVTDTHPLATRAPCDHLSERVFGRRRAPSICACLRADEQDMGGGGETDGMPRRSHEDQHRSVLCKDRIRQQSILEASV